MKRLHKKRWFWGMLAFLLVATLAVLPDSRWRIIGWSKRESFYQNRPTSYWSAELPSWIDTCSFPYDPDKPTKQWMRQPGRWEEWALKYFPLALSRVGQGKSPALLDGDADAVPVLIELLADESWRTRRIAAEGLAKVGPPAQSAWPILHVAVLASDRTQEFPLVESTMDEMSKYHYYAAKAMFAIDPTASRAAGVQAPRKMMAWGW